MPAKLSTNKTLLLILSLFCLISFSPLHSYAQSNSAETVNRGTIGLMTGEHGQLSLELAAELAIVLGEGDKLRILPIISRGSLSNITDMIFLKGIDAAIVSADVLEYASTKLKISKLKQKINYVSRLHIQDIYILARKNITSLSDLEGKSVNITSEKHGAFVTSQNIFGQQRIKIKPVYYDQKVAIEKLKTGEIDASIIISGRGNQFLSGIPKNAGLHIVPIPFSIEYSESYVPNTLKSSDYPNLIEQGTTVPILATTAVLLVFNFDQRTARYAKVARFTDAFLSNFSKLHEAPWHPTWRDINIASTIEGWSRFKPVTRWLKTNNKYLLSLKKQKPRSLKGLFSTFIQEQVNQGKTEQIKKLSKSQLFARFLEWQKQRTAKLAALKTKTSPQRSLINLFRKFINEEVSRVGKEEVLSLPKDQLFTRFLEWQRSNLGSR